MRTTQLIHFWKTTNQWQQLVSKPGNQSAFTPKNMLLNVTRWTKISLEHGCFFFLFFFFFFFWFIYFWLHWVFVADRGLSLVMVSRGYSSWRGTVFSLQWPLLLWTTGSRHVGFSSCGSWALDRRLSSCGAWA